MVKRILLLVLLLFSVNLYSQSYDKTNNDLRIIVSDTETLYLLLTFKLVILARFVDVVPSSLTILFFSGIFLYIPCFATLK